MKNLIPDFIHQQFEQQNFNGNFQALTMFIDVSGFTQMTEKLMHDGDEGAEILTAIMNNIFRLTINTVDRFGGFVAIFAGDAFTAIFPRYDDETAAETITYHGAICAWRIQQIFIKQGLQQTRFGEFQLFIIILKAAFMQTVRSGPGPYGISAMKATTEKTKVRCNVYCGITESGKQK